MFGLILLLAGREKKRFRGRGMYGGVWNRARIQREDTRADIPVPVLH